MTQEQDLHAIASQLGRILKALEKIGDELERYNEKHKWDVPNYPVPPNIISGFTCWKCGQFISHNQTHFCYETTWTGDSKLGGSGNQSTFTSEIGPSNPPDPTE